MLKISNLRRGLALLFILLGTLYLLQLPFLQFSWFGVFPRMQIVPAILAGSALILVILLVLTLVFGRLYCSVICPLGIFQDIIINLNKKRIRKNPALREERRKYQYEKPQSIMRYSILALVIFITTLGSTFLLILFDPYSIYTRISTHLFHPIGIAINNGLANIFNAFDSYTFVVEHYWIPSIFILGITVLLTGIIVILAIKKDRFWCNAICPVGTLLGLISKISVLRVVVDQHQCVSCGKCSRECKSHAIDHTNGYQIDYTRCISCYNCIDACDKQNAIQIRSYTKAKKYEQPLKREDKIR